MPSDERTRYPRELLEEMSTPTLLKWKARIEEQRAKTQVELDRIEDVLEAREDG